MTDVDISSACVDFFFFSPVIVSVNRLVHFILRVRDLVLFSFILCIFAQNGTFIIEKSKKKSAVYVEKLLSLCKDHFEWMSRW